MNEKQMSGVFTGANMLACVAIGTEWYLSAQGLASPVSALAVAVLCAIAAVVARMVHRDAQARDNRVLARVVSIAAGGVATVMIAVAISRF